MPPIMAYSGILYIYILQKHFCGLAGITIGLVLYSSCILAPRALCRTLQASQCHCDLGTLLLLGLGLGLVLLVVNLIERQASHQVDNP